MTGQLPGFQAAAQVYDDLWSRTYCRSCRAFLVNDEPALIRQLSLRRTGRRFVLTVLLFEVRGVGDRRSVLRTGPFHCWIPLENLVLLKAWLLLSRDKKKKNHDRSTTSSEHQWRRQIIAKMMCFHDAPFLESFVVTGFVVVESPTISHIVLLGSWKKKKK